MDLPHSLSFGTAPVNWNNFDLKGWREPVPFPDILREMQRAGYTTTEWDASFGTDPGALREAAAQFGIRYVAAYRWFDFLHDDVFAEQLAEAGTITSILTSIGATDLIVADALRPERVAIAGAVPDDGSQGLAPAAMKVIANNVHRLSEVTAQAGLNLRYHNHTGTYVETPAEVEALLSVLDAEKVTMCFDTGHFAFGGGNARAFVEANLDRIGLIHLKDVDGAVLNQARTQHWSFLESLRHIVFCPLGEGTAEIRKIVRFLRNASFTGHVIIEQDTCAGEPTDVAARNLAFAQSALIPD